jgi:hypothetical protein
MSIGTHEAIYISIYFSTYRSPKFSAQTFGSRRPNRQELKDSKQVHVLSVF